MAEWLERHRSTIATVVLILVAVATSVVLQLPRRAVLQLTSPSSVSLPSIKVHVVGAVVSPGVYQLPADARVEDALRAAGGPSERADAANLNLATPLRDGQQVVVPALKGISTSAAPPATASSATAPRPTVSPTSESSLSELLDLNTATKRQLEDLPGIGPVTAQKILDYRQKNLRFVSVDELRDAKLVNAPTFERIKGMLDVR